MKFTMFPTCAMDLPFMRASAELVLRMTQTQVRAATTRDASVNTLSPLEANVLSGSVKHPRRRRAEFFLTFCAGRMGLPAS